MGVGVGEEEDEATALTLAATLVRVTILAVAVKIPPRTSTSECYGKINVIDTSHCKSLWQQLQDQRDKWDPKPQTQKNNP